MTAYKPRVGRPREQDRDKTLTATKPWVAAGVSRSTWYEQKKKKPQAVRK